MAEKEYIERQAAIRIASGFCHPANIATELANLPAADVVEVRHGRWIDGNGDAVEWDPLNKSCPQSSCYYSECKEWLTASDEYPVIGLYCPNCGAKMDGGVDDGT